MYDQPLDRSSAGLESRRSQTRRVALGVGLAATALAATVAYYNSIPVGVTAEYRDEVKEIVDQQDGQVIKVSSEEGTGTASEIIQDVTGPDGEPLTGRQAMELTDFIHAQGKAENGGLADSQGVELPVGYTYEQK